MLVSLHIENIAVVESADVEFDKGFIALTGETGAGKSIVIDSINAVLGERTSKELIRNGCERATVTALFSDISKGVVDRLEEFGVKVLDKEILVTKTITETKSSVKINGQNVTAGLLRDLAPMLVDIHGQHDSQMLLDNEKHYLYIDLLSGNKALLEEYKEAFARMMQTRKKVKRLEEAQEERDKNIEFLKFQRDEIKAAQIKINEKSELKQRKEQLLNSSKIIESLQCAYMALCGETEEDIGAVSLVESASSNLISTSSYSKEIEFASSLISEAKDKLEESKEVLERLIESFDYDENELEQIEQRLEMYYQFAKKYGQSEEEILDFEKSITTQLEELENANFETVELSEILPEQIKSVKDLGQKLSESREKAAKEFSAQVTSQLKYLNMQSCVFEVLVERSPYSTSGADRVEFLISTNPGEPLKPLSKIASGGEMSRIMLSIKNVLAKNDLVPTMVFDEIDSGVSGQAASKIGEKLKETAAGKQVICVTHLAQIAAKANTHLLISKNVKGDRAVTTIEKLDFEGRKRELARIIGSVVTEANLSSAKEMLLQD